MRKFIASTIMVVILTGTIVVLLSSCSLFLNQDHSVAKSDNFAGNLVYKKIETNPVSAESHYAMGCHFQKRKKHDWAIEEFQAAVSNQPNYVEAYNRLGVSYDLIGNFDKALAAYEAALSVNPDLDFLHNNMGYSYMLQGKYDLAVASFQKAIALNPEKSRYRNNLASAYIKSGQDSAAIAALNTNKDESKAHLKVARVLYHNGEYKKAEAYYKKAAWLKPKDSQVEKELAAAGSLAEIHAASDIIDQSSPRSAAASVQVASSRYDKDGFYTVPAIPASDFENEDIVVWDIVESNFVSEKAVVETPMPAIHFEKAEKQVIDPINDKAPLLLGSLQPLDESAVSELIAAGLGSDQTEDQKQVMLEVSNGNGVRHMAKRVGHFLKEKSVVLMYLSNADHFNYDRTSIYYTQGHLMDAFQLSQKLPGVQNIQQVAMIREGNADIKVLIGSDLMDYLNRFKDNG
jgi:Flp pilus assembly protein TadD